MSTELYASNKTQIEHNGFEKSTTYKTKLEPELMECGKVFLCFISEEFVFFCGFCKNETSKYTIFEEFANHIRKSHLTLSNDNHPNDEVYKMCTEMEDKKLSPEHQVSSEFEIEYLNYDEEIEKNNVKDNFDKTIELGLSDDGPRTPPQTKDMLAQWPDQQVLQFIELCHQQECLWDVDSKLYHKSKVKEKAYQHIFQKFNDLNPNVLDGVGSVKNVINELLDLSDIGEEQDQNNEVSSSREIFEKLQLLKNSPRAKSIDISDITYASENDQNSFDEADSIDLDMNSDNDSSIEMNNLSDTGKLSSKVKYCPVCRVSFESIKDLKTHLSDLFSNLQKKSCDTCGANFKDRKSLVAHLRTHKKEKPYLCEVCSKSFATLNEMELHSAKHSEELPFVCETCGLQFKYLNNLESHKLLHGEPSFECTDCNKKFFLKRHLAYHLLKHGPTESATCDICKKTFRNKDSLLRHERKIHKIMKRRRR
ncbi:myoneurin-like [Eupeodes corollae]|uniref:myoneurin-like n=1 Tax=Eupeodes corollae TaxID=290404 RepID=UPI00248FCE13|nr:myoneurin-like [Eupeodes corollae]